MSHDLKNDHILLEQSWNADLEAPVETQQVADRSSPPSSIYANNLMDELFGDVDQILDGSLLPPTDSVKVAEPAKSALNLDLAAFVASRPGLVMARPEEPIVPAVANFNESLELPAAPTELARQEQRKASYGLAEKLLMFVGASSALAAVMIWLASQGVLSRVIQALSQPPAPTQPVATVPTVSPADQKFADYLGRSLESIEQKVAQSSGSASSVALGPAPNGAANGVVAGVPKVVVPGTPVSGNPSGLGSTSGVLLPKPAAMNGKAPGNAGLPTAPNAAPDATRNELNQVLDRLTALVNRFAPNGAPVGSSVASVGAVGASANRAGAAPANRPAAAPAPQREFIGAAGGTGGIFRSNGVTQTVGIGENIGSSGWTLVDTNGAVATIRRNGEVRMISVGEKF
ncbi:hypothetical protein [Alkalinema sp. FACHB-956]|uniref:hypothetical protein n=1 Tax=Alkalinema sp. FACHB-956 TaxID=2692768 RepID=UPI001684768B|nr:hypothetical protein [Alkalinema sp. FACHB-956]MBD2328457.1 hypothetical protein [Alkalinema sp. FACHB-956]